MKNFLARKLFVRKYFKLNFQEAISFGVMGEKTTATSTISALILMVVNLFTMVVAALMFSLGIWMVASASTLSAVLQAYGNPAVKALLPREVLSVQLGISLTALATLLFIISFMGSYGSMARSPFVLIMYSILVLLLLLLECALLYYFSTDLKTKGLNESDGQWTHGLRLLFRCCEFNITALNTVTPSTAKIPWSCCGSAGYPSNCTVSQIFDRDCQVTITNWLYRYETAIYTSLAVLHIILSSCSLVRRSRRMPMVPMVPSLSDS